MLLGKPETRPALICARREPDCFPRFGQTGTAYDKGGAILFTPHGSKKEYLFCQDEVQFTDRTPPYYGTEIVKWTTPRS